MAMLTHELDRTFRSSEKRQLIMPDEAAAYLATIKRVCVVALTLLLAGGLLAGGIALKTAIYFSRASISARVRSFSHAPVGVKKASLRCDSMETEQARGTSV